MTDEKPKKPRRGKGEGSISKVPGRELWRARISAGTDPTGKPIRKVVYGKTKREVTEKLTRLQNQKLDGKLLATNRMTVSDLLTRWLEFWSTKIAASTKREYEKIADRHIRPNLGEVEIAKLLPMQVQGLMDKLAAEGVGSRTRQYVFATLRCAMNAAVDRELISSNPCKRSILPRHKSRESSAITVEQFQALVAAAAGTRWEALFMMAVGTGMRQGELFALAWADVDLQAGVVTVKHSLQEVDGHLTIKGPKSESGRRTIRLDSRTLESLADHRKLLLAEGNAGSPWVFCSPDGGLQRKANFFRSAWKPIREAADLKALKFHELRHTNITWKIDENVPLKDVQVEAGHSTPQMVMRYAHRTKQSQDKSLSVMESRMAAAKACSPVVAHTDEKPEKAEAS